MNGGIRQAWPVISDIIMNNLPHYLSGAFFLYQKYENKRKGVYYKYDNFLYKLMQKNTNCLC